MAGNPNCREVITQGPGVRGLPAYGGANGDQGLPAYGAAGSG
ncbi:hypothetical protein D3OALGA1CA_4563 [Olavius algarvensis associated proteobacterium Delta 3]|nr:hypothetical protein D3OALGB2SA_3047 [Olavius algarvensis associated proteobacterium Delta 3]CAB5153404.1 hypothetical protein D3OALGA1CA_4563 [Olavius algarvensis associated proteobacterium Delta 3]